jgi:site-specific recombinase XerC
VFRFNDLRDAAAIRLLIDCGLRVSELTGIDLD